MLNSNNLYTDFNVLLERLQQLQVRLAIDESGDLRVRSKGRLDDEIVAAIRQHKTTLKEWLLQKDAYIKHLPNADRINLTSQQLRIWYLCQQNNSADYHIPAALILHGNIQKKQLVDAVRRLAKKHTALNLCITEKAGEVFQYIADEPPSIVWQSLDVSVNNKNELIDFAERRLQQTFQLMDAPLLRIDAYALAEPNYYLVLLNLHHLISDGVSNTILLRDFLLALDGELQQAEINYCDYAQWQHDNIQKGTYQIGIEHWRQVLADKEPLELALGQYASQPDWQEQFVELDISGDAVHKIAQQHKCTPFSVYFSAWALVLHKLSEKKHFVIATADANRHHPQLQDCVGFIANTLALPVDIYANATLGQQVKSLHQSIQQAHQHADVPFELIVEPLANYALATWLEVAIHYVEAPLEKHYSVGDMQVEWLPLTHKQAKYPLSLNIVDGDSPKLSLQYDEKRFPKEFIQHITRYVARVLNAIAEDATDVAKLSLFDLEEQYGLLALDALPPRDAVFNAIRMANQTEVQWPSRHIISVIAERVKAVPDAIAVSDQFSQLTYHALWQASGNLAAKIKAHSGQGKIIAIALDRSVRVSIAVLAVLRSGNAYLPLDKNLPTTRLLYQLQDSGTELIITEHGWRLDEAPLSAIYLDTDTFDEVDFFDAPITGHHLFNLIYTSGSTGTPKGVRVLHQGINNRLCWMQQHYGINHHDVVLQKTPLTFDVSVWELFLPLMAGSRLHYAPPDAHRDAAALQQIIAQQRISVMHFVPSMLALFIQTPVQDNLQSLRLVFCSGEALTAKLARATQAFLPNAQLHNLYGPTEASVDVSFYPLSDLSEALDHVPIGRAISNTQLHILDNKLRPVAPFCRGEIVIGGINLAEGYHQQAKLTHDAFIDNPYYLDGHPSIKLYRTGDVGRFLADGSIEYCGRNDDQVKLRGLRIELGDIEAQTLQYPAVQQAAALLVMEGDDQQLVLFYAAKEPLDEKALRTFLTTRLPLNSLPNRFIAVDELPLNASGKRDKKALISLWQQQQRVSSSVSGDVLEVQLTALWQRYFPQAVVGADDNFFELGGHSLMAGRIVAEISQQFDCDVRFADLLANPTAREMAHCVANANMLAQITGVLPEPMPASFQQQRLFIFQKLLPLATVYHMPQAFTLQGELNITALENAFSALLNRYDILHTVYQQQGDEIYQQVISPVEFSLNYQTDASQNIEEQLVQFNSQPFNLSRDLPLRALLIKRAEKDYMLAIVLHHIAGDAHTLEVLGRELITYYNDAVVGSLKVEKAQWQYGHYAYWQQQQSQAASLSYWQKQLAQAPDLLPLPLDYPRPALQSFTGAQLAVQLPKTVSGKIKVFCREQKISPFILLLSTYQLLLARLSGVDDVSVALPVSGRHFSLWQDMPGYFVNTVIIRSQQQQHPSISHFLQLQQSLVENALRHQDVALEDVFAISGRKRNGAYTPIAQVGFNYLEQSPETKALNIAGLNITPVNMPLNTSKAEMTWIFYPQDENFACVIEYNTELFRAETLTRWFSYFAELVENLLLAPQKPVHLIAHLDELQLAHSLALSDGQHVLPLNAMQRDMLIDSLLHPDEQRNHIGFYSSFAAQLDWPLWRQSVEILFRHCDQLRSHIRTATIETGAIAWQVVDAANAALPEENLRFEKINQPFDEATLNQLVEHCVHQRWDLSKPLWRVQVYQFIDKTAVIAGFHHALFDGVSIQLLGRLLKGNYERLLNNAAPLLPDNRFAEFIAEQLQQTDTEAAWQYWQQKAKNIGHIKPATILPYQALSRCEYQLTADEEARLATLCKKWRITPALYFKALFGLAVRLHQQVIGDVLVLDVVTGRDVKTRDVIGVLFDQQPNILPEQLFATDKTFADLLESLRTQRKTVALHTPISRQWQKQLFPQQLPFLFNYYVMETAASFLGMEEIIHHVIPQIDHAANLVCQVQDGKTQLHFYASDSDLAVQAFWQSLLKIHQGLLMGTDDLTQLTAAATHAPMLLPDEKWQAEQQLFVQEGDQLVNAFHMPAQIGQVAKWLDQHGELRALLLQRGDNISIVPFETAESGNQPQNKLIEAPRNLLETQLLSAWQEVLGVNDISIHDDFFSLGGHSLSAMRIANRLRERYQLSLPLAQLFERPTIAAIADYLVNHPQGVSTLPPITKAEKQDYWPLSAAQRRLWLLHQVEGDSARYNVPLMLRLQGSINIDALQSTFTHIWQRHNVLRMRIVEVADEVVWQVDETIKPDLTLHPLREDEIEAHCHQKACEVFTIASQPLSRLWIGQIANDDYVVCMVLHHMVCDAQSLRIIAQDVMQLYYANGHNVLPPLPLQYQDYAVWQQHIEKSGLLASQLNYWRDELADAPLLLGLPNDKPRRLSAQRAATLNRKVDANHHQLLVALARKHNASVFMVLLAVYQLVLARICQQHDVCIGIPRENRTDSRLENVVGFFINALVIRNDYSANLTISEWLDAVRQKTLQAFANEEVPAEDVLKALAIPRDLHYMPIVQAAFNLVDGRLPQNVSLNNIDISALDYAVPIAKFELLLTVVETDNGIELQFEYNADLFNPATIETIADAYTTILARVLAEENHTTLQLVADKDWPLTPMQQDLYLASLTRPDTLENSIGYALELPIKLDIPLWQAMHEKACATWPMLRAQLDNKQLTWLLADVPPIQLLDWSERDLNENDLALALRALVVQPYRVQQEPLLRFYLVKLNDTRFYTVLACHHMLLDGLSFTLHAYHMVTNYFTALNGQETSWPQDNFAEFIQQNLRSFNTQEHITYWKNALKNVAPLQVPVRGKNSDIQLQHLAVPEDHWAQVKQFCRKKRITPALYFKSLYALLVRFYCDAQDDFVLFDFNDGRSREYLQSVGCHYQRYLVIAEQRAFNGSVDDCLHYFKTQQKQNADKQALSLLAQSRVLPKAGSSFSYNYLYMPKSGALGEYQFNGFSYSPDFDNNTDLRVQLDNDQLTFTLCYQEKEILPQRFLERLLHISEQVLHGLEAVHDMSFVLADEVSTWSTPKVSAPLLLDAINQQIEKTPNAIAYQVVSSTLTYQALDKGKHQWAQFLQTQGINKGDRVALLVDKTLLLPQLLLAIMHCGAVYVPLDNQLPDERIIDQLQDAKANLVLCQQRDLARFASIQNVLAVEAVTFSDLLNKTPAAVIDGSDPLYMVYTSGSTGLPKASIIRHESFASLIHWYTENYAFTSCDKTLVYSSIGFDLSQKNLFALLTVGGTVVLPENTAFEPKALLNTIQANGITVLNSAPSAFYALLTEQKFAALSSLRCLLLGGEPIQLAQLQGWIQSSYFNCAIANMYGPTECTDIVTAFTLDVNAAKTWPEDKPLPIGEPIHGVTLNLINSQQQILPRGFVGELVVGGVGVSDGYWQREALNSERFKTDKAGNKTYHTGDWLHWDDSGLLYVGRRDGQIKLRGLRIEPQEVEHALALVGLSDTVVLAHNAQLIAFANNETVPENWRAALQGLLPAYMLPNRMILVNEWPLNANGKIDKHALIPLISNAAITAQPLTVTEQQIATIWQSVLGYAVDVDENFFSAGGDSLTAIRVVHAIEKEFSVQLPVASLFTAQSIRQLAQLVEREQNPWSPIVPLNAGGIKTPIYAIHALGGMSLPYRHLAEALGNAQPFYGVEAYGFSEGQTPFTDVYEMAAFYGDAIIAHNEGKAVRLIGHSLGGIIAVEVARYLHDKGIDVEQLVVIDSVKPNRYGAYLLNDAVMLKTFVEQNFAIDVPLTPLQLLSKKALIEKVQKETEGLVTGDTIERAVTVLAGFKAMLKGYELESVSVPITYIRAQDNPLNLGAAAWQKISNNVSEYTVSGTHENILQLSAREIAKIIQ